MAHTGDGRAGQGEAIIEFQAIVNTVKVSAVDAVTLTEVSIVAPSSATEAQMTDAVLRKLRYVLARRSAS
ncbi:MAG TPA: hypothetical protein VL966_03800 [Alphaproteobacteria bacterium]|jgi:hypothetical protein|nr:hypothetical protein [Alphaproteobacteria bacterium]